MAVVTKKCYYSNISKAIYFYFYSRKRTANQYADGESSKKKLKKSTLLESVQSA